MVGDVRGRKISGEKSDIRIFWLISEVIKPPCKRLSGNRMALNKNPRNYLAMRIVRFVPDDALVNIECCLIHGGFVS